METKTYNVYKFSELSQEAKENAINLLYDINVDYSWWDGIYEDARNVGLSIKEFDLDRGNYVKAEFELMPRNVANNIIKEHGENCETVKTARAFLKAIDAIDVDDKDYDDKFEDAKNEFLYSLCEDYRIILQKEFEYLTSEEAIIETIECNDYDFLENGKID